MKPRVFRRTAGFAPKRAQIPRPRSLPKKRPRAGLSHIFTP
ncbi:hypothetical protein HMPREF9440_01290, partial [Sutterella parvirubra YIT 11816]